MTWRRLPVLAAHSPAAEPTAGGKLSLPCPVTTLKSGALNCGWVRWWVSGSAFWATLRLFCRICGSVPWSCLVDLLSHIYSTMVKGHQRHELALWGRRHGQHRQLREAPNQPKEQRQRFDRSPHLPPETLEMREAMIFRSFSTSSPQFPPP